MGKREDPLCTCFSSVKSASAQPKKVGKNYLPIPFWLEREDSGLSLYRCQKDFFTAASFLRVLAFDDQNMNILSSIP